MTAILSEFDFGQMLEWNVPAGFGSFGWKLR